MAKYGLYAILLVVSTLLVVASIFLPITVDSRTEHSTIELGFPLSFVVQDQSRYPPPPSGQTRFLSPWEVPTHVLWSRFLLDVTVVAGAISLTLYALKIFFAKSGKEQRNGSNSLK